MILSFNELGKKGRLGNQMFQIASTIGIAEKNNYKYSFPKWFCNYSKKYYSDYFKNKLPFDLEIKSHRNIVESQFNYSDIILDGINNFNLVGYFQSEKYFNNVKDIIKNYFTPTDEVKFLLQKKYGELLNNSCSIHIRRGDYLNLNDYHPILTLDYYKLAIEKIYGQDIKNINFFVFSDDLEWCKKNLKINSNKINFINQIDEVLDLFLMSYCNNNIIANSTFSWWAAWLNENKEKKVVAPNNWFGNKYSQNKIDDLFCEEWIII